MNPKSPFVDLKGPSVAVKGSSVNLKRSFVNLKSLFVKVKRVCQPAERGGAYPATDVLFPAVAGVFHPRPGIGVTGWGVAKSEPVHRIVPRRGKAWRAYRPGASSFTTWYRIHKKSS